MPLISRSGTLLRGKKLKICQCYYDNMTNGELPPTFQEIADKVGLWNTSTVNYHIVALVDKGIMVRTHDGRNYRNYGLTKLGIEHVEEALHLKHIEPGKPAEPVRGIPVLGTTAAGREPRFIFGEPGERIDIEHEVSADDVYAVLVRGDSMIGDHINDGDYVFVRQQSVCDNGDIVVVSRTATSVEQGLEGYGYATLKHFFIEKDGVYLRSSNPEVEDIYIEKQKWVDEKWQIEGKVIAVFRRLHSS